MGGGGTYGTLEGVSVSIDASTCVLPGEHGGLINGSDRDSFRCHNLNSVDQSLESSNGTINVHI